MARLEVRFVPREAIQKALGDNPTNDQLALAATMCRLNALSEIKLAGSGHLGSSLSAMDIVCWLYFRRMNVRQVGIDSPDRDVYFSSKGHDVPGLYAVLYSMGILELDQLKKLRKLNGLDGHPNIGVPGVEGNSGSLGMGISKARGIAWAKERLGKGGHVYALTGDGELQEGQNWEAMQATAHQKVKGHTVIVDHNKYQTDKLVEEISSIQDLETKFAAFGWSVTRCDGHDFDSIEKAFADLDPDKPQIIIADTIKGRGVSFFEHPEADGGIYKWHSGAPADEDFSRAQAELCEKIEAEFGPVEYDITEIETKPPAKTQMEFVADAFGETLMDLAKTHPELAVLDGDLSADCRLRPFENTYPERFVENGIAEQDMASMAGGMALHGIVPVVSSFSSFLSARANEQIYTNACEHTKVIYALHFAGMIPAGPGKSHQSVRDIGSLGSLPNMSLIQPCCPEEMRQGVRWAVENCPHNVGIRIAIGPSPRVIELPAGYEWREGRGCVLRAGTDAALIAYGPVMMHEALTAAELLDKQGFSLAVINMPWLNHFDPAWLHATLGEFSTIYTLDDHMVEGGMGQRLLATMLKEGLLENRQVELLGLEEFPECGTPLEVLSYHKLDGASLAERILGRPLDSAGVQDYTDDAPQ